MRLGERFTSPVLLHIHKTLWEIKFTQLGKLGSKFSLLSSPLQTLGKLFRTFGLLLFLGPETLSFILRLLDGIIQSYVDVSLHANELKCKAAYCDFFPKIIVTFTEVFSKDSFSSKKTGHLKDIKSQW